MADEEAVTGVCAREGCHHSEEAHALTDEDDTRHDCHAEGCSCEEFVAGGEVQSPTANAPGEEPVGG